MSKLETNTIDTVSGTTNLTIGGANNTGTTTIKSNNTAAITVDSSQNVGIGTTSPTRLLTVENSSGNSNLCVKSANTGVSQVMFGDSDSDVIGNIAYNHTGNYMYTEVNGSEAMRINSDGALIINDAAYSGTLNVKGPGWITSSETTAGTNSSIVYFSKRSSNGIQMRFQQSSTTCGDITTNGSAVSYGSNSDYRLKENIADITDATTRVKQLQPKRFNFITDADRTVDGFVAHEVQDVVPEAVTGTKDAIQVWREGEKLPEGVSVGDNKLDENGNTIPEYQGIDQSKLVPVLTKALQEAITKIEELETRIQTLENA